MKQIIIGISLFFLMVMLCGCPNWYYGAYDTKYKNLEVNISFNPDPIETSTDLTIKSSNAPIFKNTSDKELTDEQWCSKFIKFGANEYYNKNFYYNYISRNKGAKFSKIISNNEALFFVKSNATNYEINIDYEHFGDENIDYSYYSNKPFDFPQDLTTDKTSYKIGEKITITSSKPFFDKATFSKEKVNKMLLYGYYIVWIEGSYCGVSEGKNENNEKQPILAKYYDLDNISSDKISFIIPNYANSGTIHVINEGGIICDNTNDLNIKGNVDGAPAYYSTKTKIIIN